jgi:hypothetical protein
MSKPLTGIPGKEGLVLTVTYPAGGADEIHRHDKLRQKVNALGTDTDAFEVHGREIYWRRRRKQNEALFSTVPLEKILGPAFTVRGAHTIKRIVSKYCSSKIC